MIEEPFGGLVIGPQPCRQPRGVDDSLRSMAAVGAARRAYVGRALERGTTVLATIGQQGHERERGYTRTRRARKDRVFDSAPKRTLP